ncbi:MAG: TrkA family potassium uptake protein [Phycisphaerales bacterium]
MSIHVIQSDRATEQFVRRLRRRLLGSAATLVGIVAASTTAFVVLGESSDGPLRRRILLGFWDTLSLISTVGALEEDFTVGQRMWAIAVIVFGLGAVLYAFGTLQTLLGGGEVREHFQRRRMKMTLESLSGHVIIAGYGSVGRAVAQRFAGTAVQSVVIDRDENSVRAADGDGHMAIQGDATDETTLRLAGAARATGLLACLDDDASNVFLTLIAREHAPDLTIVARAGRPTTRASLQRAGADRVIVPGELAGLQMSHLILKPRISDFIAAAVGDGEYDFVEIEAATHAWMPGHSLETLDLPGRRGIIVISIVDGEGQTTFNPPGDTVVQAGDTLLVVTRDGALAGSLAGSLAETTSGGEQN